MNGQLSDLLAHSVTVGSLAAAPFLAVLLMVGIGMGILQAATQVNEQAAPFLFKMAALGLTIWLAGPWAVDILEENLRSNIRAIAAHGRAPAALPANPAPSTPPNGPNTPATD